jgi:hypothetical protein
MEYVYKTAFEHGYKHAEEAQKSDNLDEAAAQFRAWYRR